MKNELIKKGIIISGVLLVGLGICVSTRFFLREHAMRSGQVARFLPMILIPLTTKRWCNPLKQTRYRMMKSL